jgi:hypothetical protein
LQAASGGLVELRACSRLHAASSNAFGLTGLHAQHEGDDFGIRGIQHRDLLLFSRRKLDSSANCRHAAPSRLNWLCSAFLTAF